MIEIVPLAQVEPAAVEALLDRAFEPGRHLRTAYRLREGTRAIPALSLAALDGGALAGTVQCWPVALAGDDGRRWPLVMVGPVAVDPARQQAGIGRQLVRRALVAAQVAGEDGATMLIGDPEYYGRFFGFTAARTGGWRLPGPFEPRRLLARGRDVPGVAGMLEPRVLAVAEAGAASAGAGAA